MSMNVLAMAYTRPPQRYMEVKDCYWIRTRHLVESDAWYEVIQGLAFYDNNVRTGIL